MSQTGESVNGAMVFGLLVLLVIVIILTDQLVRTQFRVLVLECGQHIGECR